MNQVLGIEVPETWSRAPLKRLTSLLNRGSAPDYVDAGSVRVVGQAVNQEAGLDWSRARFHGFGGDPSVLRGYLRPGDVLVNSTGTGTLGRIGYFEHGPDGLSCMVDSHVTIARFLPDLMDSRFGYYWMRSRPFHEHVYAALIVGATNQIELNRERLAEAPFPVPPLAEQRHIADFLDGEMDRIDRVNSLRIAQESALKERVRAALDDVFGMYSSGITTRLKYLLASRPRYGVLVPQFVDDGIPFIRVGDLEELEGRAGVLPRIPVELSSQYARTVVRSGDLLLSVVGTLGRSAIASGAVVGANIARAICSIRLSESANLEVLQAWFGTTEFLSQALAATSTDTAQPTLGMEDLWNFHLGWPSTSHERDALLIEVRRIRSSTAFVAERFRRQRAVLAERRQALITAAVTGQIDVPTAGRRWVGEGAA